MTGSPWRRVALLLLLSSLARGAAGQGSDYVALVTNIEGTVLMARGNAPDFQKAVWGSQLYSGDRIKTATASKVSILFSNDNVITLGPNSAISISDGPGSTSGSKALRNVSGGVFETLSDLTLRRSGSGEVGALAGLRSGPEPELQVLSPRNTKVTKGRPTFKWQSREAFDAYRVKVYSQDGLVWTRETTDTQLVYPEDELPLSPGAVYFWNVEGDQLLDSHTSEICQFSVLSEEVLQTIEAREVALQSALGESRGSYDLALGALYVSEGLLSSAIDLFSEIAYQHQTSALPRHILGRLYSAVGLNTFAVAELEVALELSQ